MELNPSNGISLEQLVLKGLIVRHKKRLGTKSSQLSPDYLPTFRYHPTPLKKSCSRQSAPGVGLIQLIDNTQERFAVSVMCK